MAILNVKITLIDIYYKSKMAFQLINALMSLTWQQLNGWEIFSDEQLGILCAFDL